VAFGVRIGTCLALKTYQFDSWRDHWAFGFEWGRIAKWLVETNMYTLDGSSAGTITEPLYPFIIAAFFYVFGIFTANAAFALIVFQSVVDSITVWVVFDLAEKIYGPVEARVAALLFALYPASVFFAVGRIGPSGITVLLVCLVLLITFRLAESARFKSAILAGSLTGLLLLAASHPLSLIFIVPLWLLWVGRNQRLRMFVVSVIFVGSAILVTTPWAVRNSLTVGEPTMAKTGLGAMLWRGNNPSATGYTLIRFPGGKPGPEDRVYLKMALAWIVENPTDFVILTLKRVVIFWSVIPRSASTIELLNGLFFVLAMALGLIGAWWPPETKPERVWLLFLFLAIFPIVFYLTVISHYRYRYYVEPLMLILASRGIHRLWRILARPAVIVLAGRDSLNLASRMDPT